MHFQISIALITIHYSQSVYISDGTDRNEQGILNLQLRASNKGCVHKHMKSGELEQSLKVEILFSKSSHPRWKMISQAWLAMGLFLILIQVIVYIATAYICLKLRHNLIDDTKDVQATASISCFNESSTAPLAAPDQEVNSTRQYRTRKKYLLSLLLKYNRLSVFFICWRINKCKLEHFYYSFDPENWIFKSVFGD